MFSPPRHLKSRQPTLLRPSSRQHIRLQSLSASIIDKPGEGTFPYGAFQLTTKHTLSKALSQHKGVTLQVHLPHDMHIQLHPCSQPRNDGDFFIE